MVDVSLDNVTFVGKWRDWGGVQSLVQEWASEDARVASLRDHVEGAPALAFGGVRFLPTTSFPGPSGAYQRSCVVDGAHLSNWCRESEFFHAVEKDSDRANPGRIEFNPNKVSARVLRLVTEMEVDHASRVDVALDYDGVSVADYTWRRDRVKAGEWIGPNGVESLVLGSRSSDRFVRVYDKALELRIDDLILTRVEGVGRKHNALSPDLLDGVEGFARVIDDGMSVYEAGKLALFLYHPEYLRSVDKRTLRDIKAMARDRQAQIEPNPAEVYRDRLSHLRECVEALQAGERIRVARVYEEVRSV